MDTPSIARTFARRFLEEGPEKIERMLLKGALDEKVHTRLVAPLTPRQIDKWREQPLTDYQVWLLCEHPLAAALFERLLNEHLASCSSQAHHPA